MPTPLQLYEQRVNAGALAADPAQHLIAVKLTELHDALQNYQPGGGRWAKRLAFWQQSNPPQGLYIHGDVGRGKSMLMDIFYSSLPLPHKRRVHFHAFMQEMHDKLHRWRQGLVRWQGGDDPMPALARSLIHQTHVLCFDEFHVTDITDAMILKRLFTALLEEGLVMVATSNWAPQDLYKDGLQREVFVPFISLLQERLHVMALGGSIDYRRRAVQPESVYIIPHDEAAKTKLSERFHLLSQHAGGQKEILIIRQHTLTIPKAAAGVAWFHFDDICGKALGAYDYQELCANFHTFIIEAVPRFTPDRTDQAKRFMLLIDTLYEHRRQLVASFETGIEHLYPSGLLRFEFARTVSRLHEMQSTRYCNR